MKKIKLGVIYGGMSSEHEISKLSFYSLNKNINRDKYNVFPIFIDKNGVWYARDKKIDNLTAYLKHLDVIFPLLHGKYGEDGTIQGLMEILNIPYVGCGVLSSSISMDKIYTKAILNKAKIRQSKFMWVKRYKDDFILVDNNFKDQKMSIDELPLEIIKHLKYPMFVKPSCGGSSIGINKVTNDIELIFAIKEAFKYDAKVIIEEGVKGREVECAVIGNDDIIVSPLGEIVTSSGFYSYDSKYKEKTELVIPSNLDTILIKKVQEIAAKAYKVVSGTGLSRIDFFVNEATGSIILNEINTMPGFTEISMFPKLLKLIGINYEELLDRLIIMALDKSAAEKIHDFPLTIETSKAAIEFDF